MKTMGSEGDCWVELAITAGEEWEEQEGEAVTDVKLSRHGIRGHIHDLPIVDVSPCML